MSAVVHASHATFVTRASPSCVRIAHRNAWDGESSQAAARLQFLAARLHSSFWPDCKEWQGGAGRTAGQHACDARTGTQAEKGASPHARTGAHLRFQHFPCVSSVCSLCPPGRTGGADGRGGAGATRSAPYYARGRDRNLKTHKK